MLWEVRRMRKQCFIENCLSFLITGYLYKRCDWCNLNFHLTNWIINLHSTYNKGSSGAASKLPAPGATTEHHRDGEAESCSTLRWSTSCRRCSHEGPGPPSLPPLPPPSFGFPKQRRTLGSPANKKCCGLQRRWQRNKIEGFIYAWKERFALLLAALAGRTEELFTHAWMQALPIASHYFISLQKAINTPSSRQVFKHLPFSNRVHLWCLATPTLEGIMHFAELSS